MSLSLELLSFSVTYEESHCKSWNVLLEQRQWNAIEALVSESLVMAAPTPLPLPKKKLAASAPASLKNGKIGNIGNIERIAELAQSKRVEKQLPKTHDYQPKQLEVSENDLFYKKPGQRISAKLLSEIRKAVSKSIRPKKLLSGERNARLDLYRSSILLAPVIKAGSSE